MTIEEYKSQIKLLEEKFEADIKKLGRSFAFSNNPYKKGDVIKDHSSTIMIQRIQFYISNDGTQCVYSGPVVKKDGTFKCVRGTKNPIIDTIYQSNIIK